MAATNPSGIQAHWKNIRIVCEGSRQQRDRGCESSDHLDYVWMRSQPLPPKDRFSVQKYRHHKLHQSLSPPGLFFITVPHPLHQRVPNTFALLSPCDWIFCSLMDEQKCCCFTCTAKEDLVEKFIFDVQPFIFHNPTLLD